MNIIDFEEILQDQPKYRLKQIKQAIFRDLITDWQEAKWLPKELREKLKKAVSLEIKAETIVSKDKDAIKALIKFSDGLKVETVLMRHNNRNTVCLSSQVGCPLGCLFCATGKLGFKRNLTDWEIVSQVLFFARLLKNICHSEARPSQAAEAEESTPLIDRKQRSFVRQRRPQDDNDRINNLVLMGMGEPFLNYDNVMSAIRILNDADGLGIGARHISISTVGIIEGIKKLAKENLQANLAISLHAPNNELRSKLIPINEKYSLEKIMTAVADYIQRTNRKVMFEYLMIKDLNDMEKCAKQLADLVKDFKKPLIMINLIKYNLTGDFKPSETEGIKKFKDILIKEGIFTTERYRFGEDIMAACGQLAGEK